ncbi:MAG: lysozyme inhibitor LprI family protein [Cyanobacteria bacterium P01_H01_bin.105]
MGKLSYKLFSKLLFAVLLLGVVSCRQPEQTAAPEDGSNASETTNVSPSTDSTDSTGDEATEPVPSPAASSSKQPAKPAAGAATAPRTAPVALAKQDCGQMADQQAMNQCAAENYAISDKALNQVYQEIRQGLDEAAKVQLTQAEERWLVFRDAECTFESDRFEGGSMAPLIQASCLEQVTDNRIAELQRTVKAETSFADADAQLNEVYQAVQALASDAAAEDLTDVQLTWLDYRDAHCEFEANLPSSPDVKACLAAMTETRVWQLQTLQDDWSL